MIIDLGSRKATLDKGFATIVPLRVLFLSRNYPSAVTPQLGLWVEGLVRHVAGRCEARVIAPVPYCPPLLPAEYSRFRAVRHEEDWNGVPVRRPRFLTGPGYSLHRFEAALYYRGVRREVRRVRRTFPFDVIHAHFGYPDGVVAHRLAEDHGVPFVITEHAPWIPWMETYPAVRRQAVRASRAAAFHLAVSRYVRRTISRFAGEREELRVVPVGVDGELFVPSSKGAVRPEQILFVGIIRHVKGVDILLRAFRLLLERRPEVRLTIAGGGFYRSYRLESGAMRALAEELGLGERVSFVGMKTQEEIARLMRESALLVLPSRAESFGAVLLEAMASGTPVVATRCGGPEDIVTEGTGILVPPESSGDLAAAMEQILERRSEYDPARLRRHALDRFSWVEVARQTVELYEQAVRGRPVPAAAGGSR